MRISLKSFFVGLSLLLSVAFFPISLYAHEDLEKKEISCNVEKYSERLNWIVVNTAPSLRFIKNHYLIPNDVTNFVIPVEITFQDIGIRVGKFLINSSDGVIELGVGSGDVFPKASKEEMASKPKLIKCELIL